MGIRTIVYTRKFNPAAYETEEFSITAELDFNEEPAAVIESMKNLVLAHRSPVKQGGVK